MENGNYKHLRIKWEDFEATVFTPSLFNISLIGCGASALALLTGIHPLKITNTNRKNPSDWKDSFMLSFLKKNGFTVKQITKCHMSTGDGLFINKFINERHVLLISQLLGRNLASWSVVHNNLWYHNFQTCAFDGLNLLNCPTLSCYIIIKNEWKEKYIYDYSKHLEFHRYVRT